MLCTKFSVFIIIFGLTSADGFGIESTIKSNLPSLKRYRFSDSALRSALKVKSNKDPSTRQISPPSVQFNASDLVDQVMERVRTQLIHLGLDVIEPPGVRLQVLNRTVAIENVTIVGLANFQRVGDVIVTSTLTETKYRSAFAFYNISGDEDVEIRTENLYYPDGHIHMDVDNVTVYKVFKFNHLTQELTLDEFELSVGNFYFSITGLGDELEEGSADFTNAVAVLKDPFLTFFNITFRLAVNAALRIVRLALIG